MRRRESTTVIMTATRTYLDREHAGRQLARSLMRFRSDDPIVVALARNGVAVGLQVASRLGAELDAVVAIPLTDPDRPEIVIGAVGEGGVSVVDRALCQRRGITPVEIDHSVHRASMHVRRQAMTIRSGAPLREVAGRTVLIVDDGMVTGARVSAVISLMRRSEASRVIVAVPVGARAAVENLQVVADEVICPATVPDLHSIEDYYEEHGAVTDAAIAEMLRVSAHRDIALEVPDPHHRSWALRGSLGIPRGARGLVIFAHGSGSSRLSPRNQQVAESLNKAGFATLLFDLLTEDEAASRNLVFDIDYLSQRLLAVLDWCATDDDLRDLPVALFGASTGAAAALTAASQRPDQVRAVVSRGGRPDLAGAVLSRVESPTLLIVGGADPEVLRLNEEARRRIHGQARLEVVPGATHLFEEPGALERVGLLASSWCDEYLTRTDRVVGSAIRYRRIS